MPYINSTEFGSITIDDKSYNQVLILGDEVFERDYSRLKKEYGTGHKIGEWEAKLLRENKPEIILIGTGQDGVLKVHEEFVKTVEKAGIELVIEKTPNAIIVYNNSFKKGKKINSLIHTTC